MYKIIVDETVTLFFLENKISVSNTLKKVKNTELMRLQLIFTDKPNDEVRTILKKNSFRWSPKNNAWQRQLTENGMFALKRVVNEINKLSKQG